MFAYTQVTNIIALSSMDSLIKSKFNQLDAPKWWGHFGERHKNYSFYRRSEFSLFALFGALAMQEPREAL